MNPAALKLKAVAGHLESFGRVGHPLGIRPEAGDNLAAAILAGTPAHLALEDAGAPERVVHFMERAAPPDVAGVLEVLSAALGRSEGRRAALASRALYPLVLAALSVLLGALVLFEVRPSMLFLAAAERGGPVALPLWPFVLTFVASLGALVYLGVVLRLDRPVFPFKKVRRAHECATLLAAASCAARQQVALPAALRAAAFLVSSGAVKDSAEGLARSLDEGRPSFHGTLLLGEVGASIFAEAATHGAGAESLEALAAYHEAAADAGLPAEVLKAELAGLLFAGLAVATATAAFMATYSAALVRW
ncbi:MAG: hypothetical protein ACYC8T_24840 [Myxococcaceae bacterium]